MGTGLIPLRAPDAVTELLDRCEGSDLRFPWWRGLKTIMRLLASDPLNSGVTSLPCAAA
jgi:hypothetical protein